MIARLVLAYAAAALVVSVPGLVLAVVAYAQTWKDIRARKTDRDLRGGDHPERPQCHAGRPGRLSAGFGHPVRPETP